MEFSANHATHIRRPRWQVPAIACHGTRCLRKFEDERGMCGGLVQVQSKGEITEVWDVL